MAGARVAIARVVTVRPLTRRRTIRSLWAVGLVGFAGCSGLPGRGSQPPARTVTNPPHPPQECIERTVWRERVNPSPPEFEITDTNEGDRPFTIDRVALDETVVWDGALVVEAGATRTLRIESIDEALEADARNFTDRVYVDGAVDEPAFFHNVGVRPVDGGWTTGPVYPDGHTRVESAGPFFPPDADAAG